LSTLKNDQIEKEKLYFKKYQYKIVKIII